MVKPRLGMKGKGCAGSIGEWRKDGENMLGIMAIEKDTVGSVEFGGVKDAHVFDAQLDIESGPDFLLVRNKSARILVDARELLRWAKAIGAGNAGDSRIGPFP